MSQQPQDLAIVDLSILNKATAAIGATLRPELAAVVITTIQAAILGKYVPPAQPTPELPQKVNKHADERPSVPTEGVF